MFYDKLFPQINGRWGEVNFNEVAKDFRNIIEPFIKENILLNPEVAHRLAAFVRQQKGIDHEWGGFCEDRSILWEGHYMDSDATIHAGIDLGGLPVGTEVHLPFEAKLVYSFIDPDQNGGWGGKLIFQYATFVPKYLVLGHLKNIVSDLRDYHEGDVIGEIAETEINGGWSPHLHVQCMDYFDPNIDGYIKATDKGFLHPAIEILNYCEL